MDNNVSTSSSSTAALPALKGGIEAVHVQVEGKPMVVLRDQEGISEQAVVVSPAGFLVAMLLDGENSASDIQTLFSQNTGAALTTQDIHTVVSQLEKVDLLETSALQQKRKKIMDDFRQSPVRKAAYAGSGYPANLLELAAFIGPFFKDPKGPGKEMAAEPALRPAPFGLVSPHIDLTRGGPAYAWAYQALSECAPPDVIVAVGVAHRSPNAPWVMTKKSYETPYGPMLVDESLYNDIRASLWYDPNAEEEVHRREHSLEFQALWLKYLWREKTPAWVPILTSSFDRFCPDRPPSTVGTIEGALQQIGNTLERRLKAGQKIMILAGIDLAHVGPRFGDEVELTPELEKRVEKEDQESLKHAMALEADAFYMSIIRDGHWRKTCGLSALYTSLRWIKALSSGSESKGQMLTYGQAPDPLGGIVSFASAIFPR